MAEERFHLQFGSWSRNGGQHGTTNCHSLAIDMLESEGGFSKLYQASVSANLVATS